MEIATTKPLKSSSNLSDIVFKFAEACKLRSIGVFPSENPLQHRLGEADEGSDATEDTVCGCGDAEIANETEALGDAEISKLFEIVSALKSAYIRLQEAHVPHDPKMIVAADELVMAELESLYKVRHAYKSMSKSCRVVLSQAKIESDERLLRELKSRVKAKNTEAERLMNELRELDIGNAKLGEKIKSLTNLERKFANDFGLDTSDFHKAFAVASKSIHDFAKPLISLMRASGWDLDKAAKAIEKDAVFSKRSHKKYAFEAYIARRMFSRMSLESSRDLDHVMRFDDPIDALIKDPGSGFAKFCGKKYVAVVHRAMEASFFGNLDHRKLVLVGKHPRTPFYQIFARMAKWVWVLQGIAGLLCPRAKVFAVNRRSRFSDGYMESVEEDKEVKFLSRAVEFMVMPGFKIGETLVKSRVYVSETEESNGK